MLAHSSQSAVRPVTVGETGVAGQLTETKAFPGLTQIDGVRQGGCLPQRRSPGAQAVMTPPPLSPLLAAGANDRHPQRQNRWLNLGVSWCRTFQETEVS
jgi:hypothetical protein